MYIYNCMKHDGIQKLETKEMWGIFLYNEGEDTNKIEGTHPLIYHSQEEMLNELNSPSLQRDMKEWGEKKLTVVIRPIQQMYLE